MNIRRNLLIAALFFVAPFESSLKAQGTKADYENADQLPRATADKLERDHVEPTWFADGKRFWYRNALKDGVKEFWTVDAEKATRLASFDHAKLAEALDELLKTKVDPSRLPIERVLIVEDGSVRFEADGKPWKFDPKDGSVKEGEPLPAGPVRVSLRPSTLSEKTRRKQHPSRRRFARRTLVGVGART